MAVWLIPMSEHTPCAGRILAAQRLMVPLTLGIHGWVIWRGYTEDGPLWAVLYALLFVYAELYWAWRSLQAHGPDLFFFLTTLAGLWWLGLFAYRQWLRRSTLSETA